MTPLAVEAEARAMVLVGLCIDSMRREVNRCKQRERQIASEQDELRRAELLTELVRQKRAVLASIVRAENSLRLLAEVRSFT